jgi:hypothetical protein
LCVNGICSWVNFYNGILRQLPNDRSWYRCCYSFSRRFRWMVFGRQRQVHIRSRSIRSRRVSRLWIHCHSSGKRVERLAGTGRGLGFRHICSVLRCEAHYGRHIRRRNIRCMLYDS